METIRVLDKIFLEDGIEFELIFVTIDELKLEKTKEFKKMQAEFKSKMDELDF